MELGELIKYLKGLDPELVLARGFGMARSYRGFYEDIAFAPADTVSVASMLLDTEGALGATFEGYKGGDYTSHDYTDTWIAEWGTSEGDQVSRLWLDAEVKLARLTTPDAVEAGALCLDPNYERYARERADCAHYELWASSAEHRVKRIVAAAIKAAGGEHGD